MLTERLQVNTRSARRIQDPREHCCGSLDTTAGVCSAANGISSRLSSVHRSCTVRRLAENGHDAAATRPQNTVSTCPVDQASAKQYFWSMKRTEASSVEAAKPQERSLPPTFDHHEVHFFPKAVTADQQSKAPQLSDKVEVDLQEIERLKAQMALLCERLAWHISRCSSTTKGACKAGMEDSFDSEESILLKGIGELKKVIGTPNRSGLESRREQGKDLEETECVRAADQETVDMMCRCKNLAWKTGISTLFQSILWCIGFIMTIVRCIDSNEPELIPT